MIVYRSNGNGHAYSWGTGDLGADPTLAVKAQNVLTQHGNNGRTGGQTYETILRPGNVGIDAFGKLATRRVEGQIYAQPLYAQGVSIQGQLRNVVYVATMKNNVYAFDADDTSPNAAPLW